MSTQVEYRVRPVTKYIVTRFEQGDDTGAVETRGQYENGEVAYQVAYALCKAEHDKSGEPIESMNFIYPKIPDGVSIPPATA
ncbi:MAG: hypothetical protein ACPG61_15590 [Paracoccaceae bacterium]